MSHGHNSWCWAMWVQRIKLLCTQELCLCNVTSQTMKTKFRSTDFEHHDLAINLRRCATGVKFWDIKKESVLWQIQDFNYTKQLAYDPMHIFLEEQVPYVPALFLNRDIYHCNYPDIGWHSSEIVSYNWSYLDINQKPEHTEKCHLINSNI